MHVRTPTLFFALALVLAALSPARGARAAPPTSSAPDEGRAAKDARSPEMGTRRAALKALVADGSARAVSHLVDAARAAKKRDDGIGVRDVAHALGQLRNRDAVPALVALVDDERKAGALGLLDGAVTALAELRDARAAPALRALLDDAAQARVHRRALLALARSTDDPSDVARFARALKDKRARDDAARAIAEMEHPALAPALVPLLVDPDVSGHDVAKVIRALSRMAAPTSAVPLMDVVERDPRPPAVSAAAEALVTCVEPEHVPRLLRLVEKRRPARLLHDALVAADRRQGHTALRGLMKSDATLATELLYAIASEPHASDEDIAYAALATPRDTRRGDPLRRAAVDVLAKIDSARAEETLCRELKDKSNASALRTDAVAALAEKKSDVAIACLIDVLDAESKLKASGARTFSINVHEDTTRALERITGERLGPDAAAFRTWHKAGLSSGLDGFVQALANDDDGVRALAASRLEALAAKGLRDAAERRRASEALSARVVDEKSAAARLAMIDALGALREKSAIPALVRVLDAGGRRALDEKVALARALDALGDGRGTATLIEDLASDDDETRAEAVRALSIVTGEPAHHDATAWRAWWKTYAERYRAP